MTTLGLATLRKRVAQGRSHVPGDGPVRTRPSAWRGEATKSTPNRPMSKLTLPQAASSISQPLHPPAETWRNFRERPNRRWISLPGRDRRCGDTLRPSAGKAQKGFRAGWPPGGGPNRTGSRRPDRPSRNRRKKRRLRGRAARDGSERLRSGRPGRRLRIRPGRGLPPAGESPGTAAERRPADIRNDRPSVALSQLNQLEHRVLLVIRDRTRIGQIEAFVADRKIRDPVLADGHGQPEPVVERRVLDLVPPETPVAVRDRGVGDLAAPAFDHGDDERPGREGRRSGRRAGEPGSGRASSCSPIIRADWAISSERMKARAKTSPASRVILWTGK